MTRKSEVIAFDGMQGKVNNYGGRKPHKLLYYSFNSDASCVTIGTRSGFSVYNVDPIISRLLDDIDGVRVIELLHCTPLLAIVGSGDNPGSSPRKLTLWHSINRTPILEHTFDSSVIACKFNRTRLVTYIDSPSEAIQIFEVATMQCLQKLPAITENISGLISLSREDSCYVAFPGGSGGDIILHDALNLRLIGHIQAHKTKLAQLTFSPTGTIIASASITGTVIRVFSVPSGQPLHTFRRGMHHVYINSLSFCPSSQFLSAGSSSGTVHVFILPSAVKQLNILSNQIDNEIPANVIEVADASASFTKINNVKFIHSNTTVTASETNNHDLLDLDLDVRFDFDDPNDMKEQSQEITNDEASYAYGRSRVDSIVSAGGRSDSADVHVRPDSNRKQNSVAYYPGNTNSSRGAASSSSRSQSYSTTTATAVSTSNHSTGPKDWHWNDAVQLVNNIATNAVAFSAEYLTSSGILPEPAKEFVDSSRAVCICRLPPPSSRYSSSTGAAYNFKAAICRPNLRSDTVKIVAVTDLGHLYRFKLPPLKVLLKQLRDVSLTTSAISNSTSMSGATNSVNNRTVSSNSRRISSIWGVTQPLSCNQWEDEANIIDESI